VAQPDEAKWIHGKRKVVELHGLLEIEERGALLGGHASRCEPIGPRYEKIDYSFEG
jgi:hypothetical protein